MESKNTVVTFGEMMLRLSPEGHKRFLQADKFDAIYGGAEANVAIALSVMGFDTRYVTKVPGNEVAQTGLNFVRSFGVDTSYVVKGGKRLGLYYIDRGAAQRGSKVIYDRANSSFAEADPSDFNWKEIFKDAKVFHLTGITPALSKSMSKICIEACKTAKEMGVVVSFDVNYRASLWSKEEAKQVLTEISKYVDICFANEEEIQEVYGIQSASRGSATDPANRPIYEHMASELMKAFPFTTVAVTLLDSPSSSEHIWGGLLYDKTGPHYSKTYHIQTVDRVGVGDAFSAGLIGGLLQGYTGDKAIEFGVAAAALKFTIEGDYNLSTLQEVEALANGGSAEIKR
ncbi:MAG: sugar kinase [Treponema sp.]|nr:sugar kinase [Treponema sp.]